MMDSTMRVRAVLFLKNDAPGKPGYIWVNHDKESCGEPPAFIRVL